MVFEPVLKAIAYEFDGGGADSLHEADADPQDNAAPAGPDPPRPSTSPLQTAGLGGIRAVHEVGARKRCWNSLSRLSGAEQRDGADAERDAEVDQQLLIGLGQTRSHARFLEESGSFRLAVADQSDAVERGDARSSSIPVEPAG